ncbi:hemolysin family protein [Planococcus sp. CAU13]|uniref:hemolysin family protein n=1 Tax=Planococcus sp. CAU13 TaxID=1541197 RepID=UPI00052FFC24|nr:hemolysin family protein [Planococcus sp. CAU13]
MDSILILNLSIMALLIALTALFVASEFALIKVRSSRIEQLISEGNENALVMKKIMDDLDYYLTACRLGITVSAIGLGWLGEPVVEKLLKPLFAALALEEPVTSILSFGTAFAIITFFHVVIGEMVPKTVAVQNAENVAMIVARPLYFFGRLLVPVIRLMHGAANGLLSLTGIRIDKNVQAHSEEDLKIMMTQSYNSGEINQTELSYMQNIFSFDERMAKDIMIPRTQMETVSLEMDHDNLMAVVREHQYTRYPVTEQGDKDDIIGFINVKEMLTNYTREKDLQKSIAVHDLPFVHDMAPIHDVLVTMQKEHVHMAIVVDEYGGTAGVITMEDILEEIVGEIRDEFDEDERDEIKELDPHRYLLDGRVLLSDLEERFALHFYDSEDVDTIGGWVQMMNTEISEGGTVDLPGHRITVREMENHQIIRLLLEKIEYN